MIQEMQPRIDMVCDKLNSSLDLSLIQGLQVKFYSSNNITRLSGRCAAIFYSNCEHFLFVYTIHCKTKTKKFADFTKKKLDFQNLLKI